jgi:predicted phosphohydrolase
MNRKQRRARSSAQKKATKDVSEKIAMFDKIPDECSACLKPFDKKDRKMVSTWNVVVREQTTVRLYCPDCWSMATGAVVNYLKEKNDE